MGLFSKTDHGYRASVNGIQVNVDLVRKLNNAHKVATAVHHARPRITGEGSIVVVRSPGGAVTYWECRKRWGLFEWVRKTTAEAYVSSMRLEHPEFSR